MKVTIFCSASLQGIDPRFDEAARDLVRRLCGAGCEIVSGGTTKGTMKVVADTVRDCGGVHIGVIPHFMERFHYPELTSTIWTDTMSERKEKMREGSDAVIALPGGIGTLDELVETITLVKLNCYAGRVVVLDVDGFYAPLRQLLDYFVETRMLDRETVDKVCFPQSVEQAMECLGL